MLLRSFGMGGHQFATASMISCGRRRCFRLLAVLSLCGGTAAHDRLKAVEGASASGKALSLDLAVLDAIRDAARAGVFVARRVAAS